MPSNPSSSPLTRWLCNPTLRVLTAAVVWLGILFGFRSLPSALRWPCRILWIAIFVWLVFLLVRTLMRTRFTWKKVVFITIIGLIQYVALALLCQVFIVVMSAKDDRITTRGISALTQEMRKDLQHILTGVSINEFDPVLGWRLKSGTVHGNYTVNAQGFRSTREHPVTPADPAKRIVCIGDSFTFGTAVPNDQTYPAHAEKLMPGTEWLNFGVPGTCLTQSYLHYKNKVRQFAGKYVIIGFMSNDAMRTVNCYRPFVNVDSAAPLTKPFVRLRDDNTLAFEPNPYQSTDDYHRLLTNDREELAKLLQLDYLTWSRQKQTMNPVLRTLNYIIDTQQLDRNIDAMFDGRLPLGRAIQRFLPQDPYGRAIYSPKTDGFKAITALFDRYHNDVVADGRVPLIVLFPGPLDVMDYRQGEACQYAPLADYLRAKHYAVLDFLPPLLERHRKDLSTESLFVSSHYQGHINAEVATEVVKALKSL